MSLNSLHTASGLIIMIGFLSKIGLQAYVDFRHGRLNTLLGEVLFFSKYLRPYRSDVQPKFKIMKYACNLLLYLVVVALLINIVVGILMLY